MLAALCVLAFAGGSVFALKDTFLINKTDFAAGEITGAATEPVI